MRDLFFFFKEKGSPFLKNTFSIVTRYPYKKDQPLTSLWKKSGLAFIFALGMGGLYEGIEKVLIPYHQEIQKQNNENLLKDQLKNIPKQFPEEWIKFERGMPGFHFNNTQIKAVFYSLCQLYNVHLKSGDILEEVKGDSFSFKPGNLIITASTDDEITQFLEHLSHNLSGAIALKTLKIYRIKTQNPQQFSNSFSHHVEAFIEFEWILLKEQGH